MTPPHANVRDCERARGRLERRSPTGIARERETSADDAAPCQRQDRTTSNPGERDTDTAVRSAGQFSRWGLQTGIAPRQGSETPVATPRMAHHKPWERWPHPPPA